MRKQFAALFVLFLAIAGPAFAQQTGSISGRVTSSDGEGLPGVVVEATSSVLPQPRQTVSGENGEYRLALLPPGSYRVTFNLDGMAPRQGTADVALQQTTFLDATLALEGVSDVVEVVGRASIIDPTSSELKASITEEVIEALPVGQEYRDLVKLVPGVQFTQDITRGPSAGGSGQDNTYQFDGVNVTLPLFGVLSAEPSSHDIEQVAVVKGGANAIDFNRAGGFLINTISKSGTNEFRGLASYQVQPESLAADRKDTNGSVFEEDKDWIVANIGGPIAKDHLYFYASYYAPGVERDNRANNYGAVPKYDSERDEYFGKLTYSPNESVTLGASYRTSEREVAGASVLAASAAGSTSQGAKVGLDIGIFDASWVIDEKSYASFRFTDFTNETQSRPDTRFGFEARLDGSVDLDINNLDQQGLFNVPQPIAGATAFNAFIAPYIQRYGFDRNGQKVGGGTVGGGSSFDNDDFFRTSYQVSYDRRVGTKIGHDLHVGYQWYKDEEDLFRPSNGWGSISVQGGRVNCPANSTCAGQPIFFQAQVLQQGIVLQNGVAVPTIHSEYLSQNLELNDQIHFSNWTLNVGLLISDDRLYGQGLESNDRNLSGFEVSRGGKYKMHEIDWNDTLQPRLGVTWAYSGPNTVYANYARYVPAASSLPRAASWARNSAGAVNVYFDRDGNFIGSTPEAASSGKFFEENIKPRTTDEYLIGTTREFGGGWSGRTWARYRYSYNFWEDTENDSLLRYNPPSDIERRLYVPNLAAYRQEIGGSSYVIAELDHSFTKYWEAGVETEWRGGNAYFRGTYVWSHYYGNMDQDNSAGTAEANDAAIFIGSSNIADGGGRQLWDNKYGDLRGDRPHQLKLFGYYKLPWHASVGAFGIYQSGQPWEKHDREFYRPIIGTSTSDTNRYAEPAGSHRTDDHHQVDLNYTQDLPFADRFNVQLRVDVFNIYDKQTGYDIQHNFNSANYGTPQSFYDPRRFQVALRFEF